MQEKLALGSWGNSLVTEERLSPEDALRADQILVGRNKTRTGINGRVRQLRAEADGETLLWHPVPGDRLVCLRNNHDKGLLNGAIWHTTDVGSVDNERIVMTLDPDMDGSPQTVEAHAAYFQGGEVPFWNRKDAEEFDYGYALTVHKSQGSQWDDVLLYDESWCFRQDRHRWLYTGITRAAERVTVVRS
jgi:exodeoxyribonuclease-5